jgi:hypothetical protein
MTVPPDGWCRVGESALIGVNIPSPGQASGIPLLPNPPLRPIQIVGEGQYMADFDFNGSTGGQAQRLRNLVSANAARGDLGFNWIRIVTESTLPQYLLQHFHDGFSSGQPDALPVADNMAEAGRLLDASLGQQREILQAEAQAILAALDICLAKQTLEASRAVAIAELAAAIRTSGQDNGAQQQLKNKFDTQSFAIDERLRLHNLAGGALNYGERIEFLRKLYVRNVSKAADHLRAAYRGLTLAYGARLPEPIVSHYGDKVVEGLIDWHRMAVEIMNKGRRSEQIVDIILYLVNDNICPDLRTFFATEQEGGDRLFEFTINPRHFRQYSVYNNTLQPDPNIMATRILGMDAAFICGEDDASWLTMYDALESSVGGNGSHARDRAAVLSAAEERMRSIRASRTAGLEFLLPEPKETAVDGTTIAAPTAPVRFGAVPVWSGTSARDQFRPISDLGVADVNPFGKWGMAVNQYLHGPTGRSKFGALMGPQISYSDARNMGLISDIALFLRVAIRPRFTETGA